MISNTEENISLLVELKKNVLANKSFLITSAKIIIAIGLISYLFFAINFSEIINTIVTANLYFILLSFVLSIVNIYLQYYKWKLTAKALLQENKPSKIFYSLFYGFSAGLFTPARIGEYFGRAIVFKDKSFLQVTLATVVDKIFPFLVITFIGSISSVLFLHSHYQINIYLTLSLLLLILALFYTIYWLVFNNNYLNKFLFDKLQKSAKPGRIYEKIIVLKNLDKEYSVKMIVVSLFFYLCIIIQYALLIMSFSHHNSFENYLIAGNLIMFSKTIIPPISFGELGIREGASVFFISLFGESASTGFNASIFLFLINILVPSLVGLILLLRKNND